MSFFRQSLTVAAKDLRSELRGKETLNSSISFSIVILLLFSFAFNPTSEIAGEVTTEIAGGFLWLVFTFAGALVINRSFARDLPNDCLDALLASPLSPASLFFGKAIANFILLLAIEVIALPVFGLFYNLDWTRQLPSLILVALSTTWALSAAGTTFSAMTVNLRLREIMLPMLLYPMMIPCLLAAIELTTVLIAGKPITGDQFLWVRVLAGFDVIYTALALMLVDHVLVG